MDMWVAESARFRISHPGDIMLAGYSTHWLIQEHTINGEPDGPSIMTFQTCKLLSSLSSTVVPVGGDELRSPNS